MNESDNEVFFAKARSSLGDLFDSARRKNELHFALALAPEMRGMRDPGWNTAHETSHAFKEYMQYIDGMEDGRMKVRILLSFYCHVAEASGFYEVPKNMLRISGGEPYVLWPFKDLVRTHAATGEKIAPNANKVIKDLVGHAASLGFDELSGVFRDAFDPDVRNGYAHADYVIWNDALRLPRRNGGTPREIPWAELNFVLQRGFAFFEILHEVTDEHVRSYDPPRTINGQMGSEPESQWTIYFIPSTGQFGMNTGPSVGPGARDEK